VSRFVEWKRELRSWFEHFFLTGDPLRSLTRICLALLIVFFLKNLCDYLQSMLTVWVEQAVVRDLRDELYGHLHDLSLSFFHSRRTGGLLSRLTNDISLVRGSCRGFSNLIRACSC
jgi:subfamily B ATP-binding cassette protein MsbA